MGQAQTAGRAGLPINQKRRFSDEDCVVGITFHGLQLSTILFAEFALLSPCHVSLDAPAECTGCSMLLVTGKGVVPHPCPQDDHGSHVEPLQWQKVCAVQRVGAGSFQPLRASRVDAFPHGPWGVSQQVALAKQMVSQ